MRTGDFFTSWLFPVSATPSCITAACEDELNVNFVLPELCCTMLPFGSFITYANDTLDFLMPPFLAAALAEPQCRDELLADTQRTWSWLQADQRLRVNVFPGVAAKLPYCNDTCLPEGITQINVYIPHTCPGLCPQAPSGVRNVLMDYSPVHHEKPVTLLL